MKGNVRSLIMLAGLMVTFFILIFTLLDHDLRNGGHNEGKKSSHHISKRGVIENRSDIEDNSKEMKAGAHLETIAETEVAWMRPENTSRILLLFHPCKCSAKDFFTLPEELTIVTEALQRNFFVVAFSTRNLQTGCWDEDYPLSKNDDWLRVQKAINELFSRESLWNFPKFGFGASNGADFISMLPTAFSFEAIVVQISSGNQSAIRAYEPHMIKKVYFFPLSGDTRASKSSKKHSNILKKKGINSLVAKVTPRSASATYFSEHIKGVNKEQSQKIFDILLEKNFLQKSQAGIYLEADPGKLPEVISSIEGVTSEKPSLIEELHALMGKIALTSEYCRDWLNEMVSGSYGNKELRSLSRFNRTLTRKRPQKVRPPEESDSGY